MKPAIHLFTTALLFVAGQALAGGGNDSVSNNSSTVKAFSVNITSFQADFTSNPDVRLDWKTNLEAGIDHYSVERSTDAVHFTSIARVSSAFTVHTNAFELFYGFKDEQPVTGISYYRLRVEGKDTAQHLYSPIVKVSRTAPGALKIYPTILEGNTIFVEMEKAGSEVRIEFFDLSGRRLGTRMLNAYAGRQPVEVPSIMHQVPSGSYVVRLSSGNQPLLTSMLIVPSH